MQLRPPPGSVPWTTQCSGRREPIFKLEIIPQDDSRALFHLSDLGSLGGCGIACGVCGVCVACVRARAPADMLPFIGVLLRAALLSCAPSSSPIAFCHMCRREDSPAPGSAPLTDTVCSTIVSMSDTSFPPKVSERGWAKSLEMTAT